MDTNIAIFWLNVVSLIVCILMIINAYRNRNLIGAVYMVVFAFLVVGQAIHISNNLFNHSDVQYLRNTISSSGHAVASCFVFYITIMLFVLDLKFSRKLRITVMKKQSAADRPRLKKSCILFYLVSYCLFFLFVVLVVKLVGGTSEWLYTSRPRAHGSTFFIILLGMFMYPLIIKTFYGMRSSINDWTLFIMSNIMVLSFARLFAILFMLLLIFSYYYNAVAEGSERKIKTAIKVLLVGGVIVMCMFFLFGAYRHALNRVANNPSVENIASQILANPHSSLLSLDLNYRIGIEGMSGFSGVMTQVLETKNASVDLGISMFGLLYDILPSFVRPERGGFYDYTQSFYWYNGSVVPSGIESFYMHYSIFGLLIYPFIFFFLSYWVNSRLTKVESLDKIRDVKGYELLVFLVMSTFGLQIIRGSSVLLIEFMFIEVFVFVIVFSSMRLFMQRHKKK